MDVAEGLFAEHGYDGVSIRDITDAAEIRLASINYYFDSKENLFREVVQRRAVELNEAREQQLMRVNVMASRPELLHQIVEAYMGPLFNRVQQDNGWRDYGRLIAQLENQRSRTSSEAIRVFSPTARKFVAALQACLGNLADHNALFCFNLMVGGEARVFAQSARVRELSDGRWSGESNLELLYQHLLEYTVAAIGGVAHLQSSPYAFESQAIPGNG